MALGILVEYGDRATSLIWLTENGEVEECSSTMLPSAAVLGSWLWLEFTNGRLSLIVLHDYDVRVRLNPGGAVTILDWCFLPSERRGWAFSSTLGWTPHDSGLSINRSEPGTAYLLRITWSPKDRCFCVLDQKDEGRTFERERCQGSVYSLLMDKYNRQTGLSPCHVSDRASGMNSHKDWRDNKDEEREEQEEYFTRDHRRGLPIRRPSSYRNEDRDERGWQNAVVCSVHERDGDRMFFFASSSGVSILHEGFIPDDDFSQLQLGSYVQIKSTINQYNGRERYSEKVVALRFVRKPPDHDIDCGAKHITVTCDAHVVGREDLPDYEEYGGEWQMMENDFLGRIVLSLRKRRPDRVGSVLRVKLERRRSFEPVMNALAAMWVAIDVVATSRQDIQDSKHASSGMSSEEHKKFMSSRHSQDNLSIGKLTVAIQNNSSPEPRTVYSGRDQETWHERPRAPEAVLSPRRQQVCSSEEVSKYELQTRRVEMQRLESASSASAACSDQSIYPDSPFETMTTRPASPVVETVTASFEKAEEVVRIVRSVLFTPEVRAVLVRTHPQAYNKLLEICHGSD